MCACNSVLVYSVFVYVCVILSLRKKIFKWIFAVKKTLFDEIYFLQKVFHWHWIGIVSLLATKKKREKRREGYDQLGWIWVTG